MASSTQVSMVLLEHVSPENVPKLVFGELGFGVPYFDTFFLKGTLMK